MTDTKDPGQIDFYTFVLSLASSAFIHLGDAPHPETGAPAEPDLPLGLWTRQRRPDLVVDREQALRLREQLLSRLGQHHALTIASKEGAAETFLQPLDLLTHR